MRSGFVVRPGEQAYVVWRREAERGWGVGMCWAARRSWEEGGAARRVICLCSCVFCARVERMTWGAESWPMFVSSSFPFRTTYSQIVC